MDNYGKLIKVLECSPMQVAAAAVRAAGGEAVSLLFFLFA
jgi:hypothetical protein